MLSKILYILKKIASITFFCFYIGFLKTQICYGSQQPYGLVNPKPANSVKRRFIEPRIIGSDSRFKVLPYRSNGVYRITFPYDTTTYIELENGETLTNYSFNDNLKQTAWDIATVQNRIYLRPVEDNADCQVTFMTNKRVYYFEFLAREPEMISNDSFKNKDFTFSIKFNYPSAEDSDGIKKYATSSLPNLEKPEEYNFNYTITGEETIFPTKIFDDGRFTYFEFREKGGIIPAIFTVDSTNHESLANYRIVGPYVAVEILGSRFTLRYGNDIVCVYNESIWLKEKELVKKKESFARFD